MALPIGSTAPDFTLKTKTDKWPRGRHPEQKLRPEADRAALLSRSPSPASARRRCATSLGGIAAFRDLNAQVYGISIDSPFAQEAWAKKENITITLLSDLDKKVITDTTWCSRASRASAMPGARAAFVIDKSGKIVYAEQTPTPKDLPDLAAVKERWRSCKPDGKAFAHSG